MCGVLVFTWVRIQQHYPVLPVYVVFQCLPGYSYYNHKSSAEQTYWHMQRFSVYLGKDVAALPSFTGVCSVLVFTWVTLQQPQKQHYPILAMCEIVFTWVNSSHRSAAQFHQWYVVF